MTRFDFLYSLALPGLLPYLAWRRLSRGKYNESAGGMLGRRLPTADQSEAFAPGSVWLHAVSVGEIAAAKAIAPGLRQVASGQPLVVSTITETGQAAARKAFPEDAHTYFPLDFSPNVRRFQTAFNPAIFIMLETEIWPNFLTLAARRGTRCFMINARLSDRSFPRYLRFRKMIRPALSALEGVCTQTDVDAERFAALGIPEGRIRVTGNCKFDLNYPTMDDAAREALMAELGMSRDLRWIVAGSTHPGEETLMLETLRKVRELSPRAGLLLCPRHPDRFDEVARLAAEAGFRVSRASRPDAAAGAEVVVLDRMGVLAKAYGLGEVAIVAGSFCPVGGHNLMEAAAHGIPVIYGPRMHSQREILRLFQETGSGLQVEGKRLATTLIDLLGDPKRRRREGRKALVVIEENRGSATRAVEAVEQWLKEGAS